MSDIQQELLAAFEAEHKEHIGAIRSALSRMRAGEAADLRDVFRRAHSLKGAARAVDLPDLEGLAHQLESVFARIAENTLVLQAADFNSLQAVLDLFESYVAARNRGAALPSLETAAAALEAMGGEALGREVLGREVLGREALARETLGREAADGEAVGSEARSAQSTGGEGPAQPVSAPAAPTPAEPIDSELAPIEYLRVPIRQIDLVSAGVHDLAREIYSQNAQGAALRQLLADERGMRRQWDGLRAALRRDASATGNAVESSLAAFEEQLNVFRRGLAALAHKQARTDWSVGETVRQVRQHVDKISLIPAEAVFGDMSRMTRALARDQNTIVEVTTTGLDIQADRSVLQQLREPVIHILRNAISHGGTESAEERRAKSKPPALQISLDISSRGGELVIVVRDDGPGPDMARIEAIGREKGLVNTPIAGLQGTDLFELLFEAGFSTSREVDAMSGRGVGLSVVAEEVRRLRGRVGFFPGHPGAEVRITTPLSAARQSLLFVDAGGRPCGLPVHAIEQLLRLNHDALVTVESAPMVRIEIGGQHVTQVVVPLISLGRLLNMQAPEPGPAQKMVNAVLLRQGSRRLAVQVDSFIDVQPSLVGSVTRIANAPPLIAGTVLLDDDMPALVLDPDALFDEFHHSSKGRMPSPRPAAKPPTARRAPTILVVDDFVTTRTLEKSILEAQGYRVLLSVDGMDALTALQSADTLIDLVVADVEMPRLDGFGLLQAMKNDPRLASIPVIVVTSREDPGHVRRGLELGAAAYLTKQKFDQRELLATIGQLL